MLDEGTVNLTHTTADRGWIAHLEIDHARRRNAIGPAVIAALQDRCAEISSDPNLRAVTLQGAGGLFAAGANVKVMAELDPESARGFITSLHHAIDAVRRLPVPVIAVLQGHCYGAAMELAAACDMRIADTSLIAGMPEVRVGLPSVIEACLLPRLIGWGRTSELLLTGRDVNALECRDIGFVERVAVAEKLQANLQDWLDAIMASAPGAVRAQKRVMQGWERDLSAGIEASIAAFAASFETDEPRQYLPSARGE
ncbi:MAG: enoyl-CoA hydratase-related protein [Pseudomonadota bacterium]